MSLWRGIRHVEDLHGHDFRRVVIPLRELGFLKSSFFNLLSIGIIVDLELDIGASGDLHLSPDSFHDSSERRTFHEREGLNTSTLLTRT
jgi:hypothetical protein